jgi:hypothetical protein
MSDAFLSSLLMSHIEALGGGVSEFCQISSPGLSMSLPEHGNSLFR